MIPAPSSSFLTVAALIATCVSLPLLSGAQESERGEENKAGIYRQATDIARGFVSEQRSMEPETINVASIMADAERFSMEAREMQDSVNSRLTQMGEAGRASGFFSEDGKIDAAALASAAGDIARSSRSGANETPHFVSFVSLSMPDAALKSIIRDTNKAGGIVMVRGFYGGSYTGFANRVRELFEEGDEVGISLDPRYFQALNVKTVPTFAVLLSEPECEAFVCGSVQADTISGNISVGAALQLLADQGKQAPAQARAALERLEQGS